MKFNYKIVTIIVTICAVTILLIGGFGLAQLPAPAVEAAPVTQDATINRTITVIGEGRVKTDPDMAQVTMGVESMAPTVQEAADQTSATMETLMTTLQAEGIDPADIQTTNYNLFAERPFGPEASGNQTTYRFSNNVSVIIRDLDKIEQIMAAAIEAGANNIFMGTFSLSDPVSLRAEARKEAVNVARSKAQELAGLNGVTLGDVISVSEVINNGGMFFNSDTVSMAEGRGGGGPITPGQVALMVQLEVTYAIE